ncbi:MAG: ATP synthase F1 subunit epsilon [Actinobacteria bacterium]|nr:MAG: ATP synthase F1 subunit epsilon [Actinomycetota bacterium]RIK03061.1 MAG: ATP synthase F1 subunit epsilon [Acidobacteriota bacterium]
MIVTLQVELVSPERIVHSGEAEMVIARTEGGGDIAFMAGHVPFIGILAIHPLRIIAGDGSEEMMAVHSGFVEVSGDRVAILSDVCEVQDEIVVERAREARDRAREAAEADPADEKAERALRRALVRLEVAGVTE